MFEKCGETIKKIALVFVSLCGLAAVILLFAEMSDTEHWLLGNFETFIGLLVGLLVAGLFGGVMMYGFGEIICCVQDIRNQILRRQS